MNTLEREVINIVKQELEEGYPLNTFIEDLRVGGCQSGMIGELIYYTDTMAFYDRHREEIDTLLSELIEETGLAPQELFGDKWDKSDPLAREQWNINLLAWFAFEETAFRLAEQNSELFEEV